MHTQTQQRGTLNQILPLGSTWCFIGAKTTLFPSQTFMLFCSHSVSVAHCRRWKGNNVFNYFYFYHVSWMCVFAEAVLMTQNGGKSILQILSGS